MVLVGKSFEQFVHNVGMHHALPVGYLGSTLLVTQTPRRWEALRAIQIIQDGDCRIPPPSWLSASSLGPQVTRGPSACWPSSLPLHQVGGLGRRSGRPAPAQPQGERSCFLSLREHREISGPRRCDDRLVKWSRRSCINHILDFPRPGSAILAVLASLSFEVPSNLPHAVFSTLFAK